MISSSKQARPITVLIPAYGAADQLSLCLDSLLRFAPPNCRIFILDDATPDESVRAAWERTAADPLHIQYVRSHVNCGFVRTCNRGAREFRQDDSDLLLLNSDTEITEGSLEEMQHVLRLHEKHAVVMPRSNNAPVFAVAPLDPPLPADDAYRLWLTVKNDLPRYAVVPTAVGFCMLIKSEVLERFELFDELYSPGYNEENDFVCRINRYGYSALAANQAFVFHHEGSPSFGSRKARLETVNHERLRERYPEYERKLSDYVKFHIDPVEVFAGLRLRHRPRVLFDLFHLPSGYTGTSEFGLNLLREVDRITEDEFDLYVGMHQPDSFFDNDLAGYQIYEDRPGKPMTFDLVFKPCQVFSWPEFQRMNRLAPRLSFVLQDIIVVRCEYLNSPARQTLFRKAAELSDCVFAISEFSQADYAAFYGGGVPMRVIHQGTNERAGNGLPSKGDYILLIGNNFTHKGVADALQYLPLEYPVLVIGGREMPEHTPNVQWRRSGEVSHLEMREAMAGARLLIYPSYYEGFGLPVIDALAIGKPVIALGSELNQEVGSLLSHPNFQTVRSLRELPSAVSRLWNAPADGNWPCRRSWRDVGLDYVAAFRELLSHDVDLVRLRSRWTFLRALSTGSE